MEDESVDSFIDSLPPNLRSKVIKELAVPEQAPTGGPAAHQTGLRRPSSGVQVVVWLVALVALAMLLGLWAIGVAAKKCADLIVEGLKESA